MADSKLIPQASTANLSVVMTSRHLEAAGVEAAIEVHQQMIEYHQLELESKRQRLKVLVEPKTLAKSRRVYVDGCYDLMHSGHYNALRQAKKIAGPDSILVAGVHSCKAIAAAKGPAVFSDVERLLLVESCKYVDEVVFDTPYTTTLEVMDDPRVNCKYCAHGDDLAPMYLPIRDAGRMLVFKRTEGTSTTDLIGRLLMLPDVTVTELRGLRHGGVDDSHLSPTSAGPANAANTPAGVGGAISSAAISDRSKKMSGFLPTARRIAAFSNNRVPNPGDKIVYLDGVFDMFNAAHVRCIKVAKAMGDFLYVAIHSDEMCRAKWGSSFPIMDLHERALCVLSNKYVDEVVLGAPWEIDYTTMQVLNIDLVCDGGLITKLSPSVTTDVVDSIRDALYQDAIQADKYARVDQAGVHEEGIDTITLHSIITRIEGSRAAFKKRQQKKVKAEDLYIMKQQISAPTEV
jgi:ethanolamine-phosphate cytidylyltransferase